MSCHGAALPGVFCKGVGKFECQKSKTPQKGALCFVLAETEGFEPSIRVLARMLP